MLLLAAASFAQISGQQCVAPDGVSTYSVQAPGAGAFYYVWGATGGWTILSGQGTSSVSVKAPAVPNDYRLGNITVTAYGCPTTTYNLPVVSMAVPLINSPGKLCPNSAMSVSIMNYGSGDPNVTASWFLSGINQTASLNNNFTIHLATPYNFNYGDIEVVVTFNNGSLYCGSQNSYVISNCYYDDQRAASAATSLALKKAVTIYPNPADSQTKQVQVTLQSSGKYELSVLNKLGKPVMHYQDVVGQAALDVSKLEPGVYFLHVTGKEGKTVKQFIVR